MCPTDARTSNSSPRYLPMVFALAGDSTMTSDLVMVVPVCGPTAGSGRGYRRGETERQGVASVARSMAGRAHDDAEGLIVRIDRGWSTVLIGDEELRVMNVGADVAVGDVVVLDEGRERVASVMPRRTAIVRRATGEGARAARDVVAANVDVVFVVQAADLPPNPRRTERELALALDSGADVVLVANKCDLVGPAELDEVRRSLEDSACGTPVLAASAATGEGMDAIRAACAGRTVALVGASGAGKSTMVNALVGGEVQRTGEVRTGDGRGRHTTTAAELVPLPGGGWLLRRRVRARRRLPVPGLRARERAGVRGARSRGARRARRRAGRVDAPAGARGAGARGGGALSALTAGGSRRSRRHRGCRPPRRSRRGRRRTA
ncbi:MAG: GTPase RsgA [Actinobacteria bacterium]|nr:GTPase RsgA [Actinomycetota bacterium]